VSHNKQSHKVEVLARIYLGIIRESREKWGEGRKGETFSVPHTGNEGRLRMVIYICDLILS
jgi:hypothetical protein